jgi:hypothetical protein
MALNDRSLEDDLPELISRRTLDLHEVASLLAMHHMHLEVELARLRYGVALPLDRAVVWLRQPGSYGRELRNLEQQVQTHEGARYLLAPLIASRRRHICTLAQLKLSAVLDCAPVRLAAEELLQDNDVQMVARSLHCMKEAVVEHGIARPYVAAVMKGVRRRTIDVLHEAHLAYGSIDESPEGVMASYVTEEISNYLELQAESELLVKGARSVRRAQGGGGVLPFRRPDPA